MKKLSKCIIQVKKNTLSLSSTSQGPTPQGWYLLAFTYFRFGSNFQKRFRLLSKEISDKSGMAGSKFVQLIKWFFDWMKGQELRLYEMKSSLVPRKVELR